MLDVRYYTRFMLDPASGKRLLTRRRILPQETRKFIRFNVNYLLLESALEDAAGEILLQRDVDSHSLGLYGLGEVDYAELVLGH